LNIVRKKAKRSTTTSTEGKTGTEPEHSDNTDSEIEEELHKA